MITPTTMSNKKHLSIALHAGILCSLCYLAAATGSTRYTKGDRVYVYGDAGEPMYKEFVGRRGTVVAYTDMIEHVSTGITRVLLAPGKKQDAPSWNSLWRKCTTCDPKGESSQCGKCVKIEGECIIGAVADFVTSVNNEILAGPFNEKRSSMGGERRRLPESEYRRGDRVFLFSDPDGKHSKYVKQYGKVVDEVVDEMSRRFIEVRMEDTGTKISLPKSRINECLALDRPVTVYDKYGYQLWNTYRKEHDNKDGCNDPTCEFGGYMKRRRQGRQVPMNNTFRTKYKWLKKCPMCIKAIEAAEDQFHRRRLASTAAAYRGSSHITLICMSAMFLVFMAYMQHQEF